MKKTRFLIVGSGYRSLFYVRIAKALPQYYESPIMLCRREDKAKKISEQYGISTSLSEEECLLYQPDFIVIAVDKAHIAQNAMHFAEKGFPVLAETPAGMDIETLEKLYLLHKEGKNIHIAEQYHLYPIHRARIRLVETGILGKPDYIYLSQAHEYHGASLMRSYLSIGLQTPFKVSAKQFDFPVTETYTRYEHFTDGRIKDKPRTLALFEFENGKVCAYDFDSEQYRSPIRNDLIKIQGSRGEIIGNDVFYLNEENKEVCHSLKPKYDGQQIEEISFKGQILYKTSYRQKGFSQDESAIAQILAKMAVSKTPYPLEEALQDAYMAILLRQAVKEKGSIASREMIWQG